MEGFHVLTTAFICGANEAGAQWSKHCAELVTCSRREQEGNGRSANTGHVWSAEIPQGQAGAVSGSGGVVFVVAGL